MFLRKYLRHFLVGWVERSETQRIEIQKLCELMFPHFYEWAPAIAEWYEKNRLGKAKLSP